MSFGNDIRFLRPFKEKLVAGWKVCIVCYNLCQVNLENSLFHFCYNKNGVYTYHILKLTAYK